MGSDGQHLPHFADTAREPQAIHAINDRFLAIRHVDRVAEYGNVLKAEELARRQMDESDSRIVNLPVPDPGGGGGNRDNIANLSGQAVVGSRSAITNVVGIYQAARESKDVRFTDHLRALIRRDEQIASA